MKLKKLSAMLAAMLCICSFSAPMADVKAIDETSQNSLVDIVSLHKWLTGKGNLENWKKFDYNHDEKINIFDFVLMKQSILGLAKPVISSASTELSKDIPAQEITGKEADEDFIQGQTKFALELFQNAVNQNQKDENIMISPYSVVQALGMSANGADGNTKMQMEQTIGSMPMEELNQYLYTQRMSQPDDEKCKLSTANSIWIRDDMERIQVKEDFLQTNANYYHASVFKAPFDESTVTDINNWVKKHTDNMIPKVLNEINKDTLLYLINAVAFDAEWQTAYYEDDIWNGRFTDINDTEQSAQMMFSEEYYYLEDEHATGFYKYYQGGRYAFTALLPDEDISVTDYVNSLTPESLQNLLANPKRTTVRVTIPKFQYEYEIKLKDTLSAMGMPDAFRAGADFSRTTETIPLAITDVIHKTYIDVSEKGTRAGAVTVIPEAPTAVPTEKHVTLNRPFVYGIVDTETSLPVFLGVLNSVPETE